MKVFVRQVDNIGHHMGGEELLEERLQSILAEFGDKHPKGRIHTIVAHPAADGKEFDPGSIKLSPRGVNYVFFYEE